MKKVLALLSALAVLASLMTAFATSPASAAETCPDGTNGFTKTEVSGEQTHVTATAPTGFVITAYCVKAGQTTVTQSVSPPQQSITITSPSGQAISHYSIQVVAVQPVNVSKTATVSCQQPRRFEIDKTVAPALHELLVGGSADSTYTVQVTRSLGAVTNCVVSGTISVQNTNNFAVQTTVSDVLSTGTAVAVDCDPATAGNQATTTVAANSTATCTYSSAIDAANREGLTNTATATNIAGLAPSSSGAVSAGTPTITQMGPQSVNVLDAFNGGTAVQLASGITDTTTLPTYTRTFTCPAPGDNTFNNVASVVDASNGTVLDTDDADVRVVCTPPPVVFQGCTPGFYGFTSSGDFTPANRAAWAEITRLTGWTPDMDMPTAGTFTFRQALNGTAGSTNTVRQLNFHTAAALLNAANPNVNYPLTVDDIVAMFAGATTRAQQDELKNLLDTYNNLGCPDRGGFAA